MANLLFFNVERGHRRPRKLRLSNNSLIDDYTDEELRARYRFGRQSILYITNLLARDLRRSTARSHALTPLHQVLIAVRFFASGSFLQVIGDTEILFSCLFAWRFCQNDNFGGSHFVVKTNEEYYGMLSAG